MGRKRAATTSAPTPTKKRKTEDKRNKRPLGKSKPSEKTNHKHDKKASKASDSIVARKPPTFSWIIEGVLAGHGRPTKQGHFQFLHDRGVKYLVTLTLQKPIAIEQFLDDGIHWIHIPIQDSTAPSMEQISQFVDAVDNAKTEGVGLSAHCAWGRGRTGTMLACYLVKDRKISASKAIDAIRKMRPRSIDTDIQINAVKYFQKYLKGKTTSK